jgi:hypothetical protein
VGCRAPCLGGYLGFADLRCEQEILNQLEPRERIVKLEETFRAVEEDYERILERAALEI